MILWFTRAADMPKAPTWMRPLAAVTLAEGGKRSTSRALWTDIEQNTDIDWLRKQAHFRLQQLDAMDGIDFIERIVEQYRAAAGRYPSTWADMIRARYLKSVPSDPAGTPFRLDAQTGKVTLDPRSSLNPLPSVEHPL